MPDQVLGVGSEEEAREESGLFGFPNPVNEKAARVVAGCVALLSVIALATGWLWILPVMALGFWARVLTGPTLSPLGQLATRVVAPLLGESREVPGPPKRFAQAIGAVLTTTGSVLLIFFGLDGAAIAVLAIMALFATLEAVFALCVGCQVFQLLIRAGVIPQEVCEACENISLRNA
jgi:hypothetical protein